MRKFFAYEFKKRMWTMIILTLICAVPYVVTTFVMDSTYEAYDYRLQMNVDHPMTPMTWMVWVELLIMCFVVPVLTFSFKMRKRTLDCYYALPIKKEKLFLVKTLIGLCTVFIPFTAAYFSGFFIVLLRLDGVYHLGWYFVQYLGLLFFGVCLFGFNSFTFTRANHPADGVVFMLAYTFVAFLVLLVFEVIGFAKWEHIEKMLYFISPAGSAHFMVNTEALIMYGAQDMMNDPSYTWNGWMFAIPAVYGVIGYTLLFTTLRFEKAENAEQNSDSWFGYRVLIPIYVACVLAFVGLVDSILWWVPLYFMIASVSVVLTVIYRRSFRIKGWYWLMLGIGHGVGMMLSFIMHLSVY